MVVLAGESELPTRPDRETQTLYGPVMVYRTHQIFVRSKSNPRILIDYHDGEVFERIDGKRWEWPGYKREREITIVAGVRTPGPWSEPVGCGAYCDSATYPYAEAKAA